MKNIILPFALVLAALSAGCDSQTGKHEIAPTSGSAQQTAESGGDSHKIHGNPKEAFFEHLKSGKELYLFFNDRWALIYHEDNRCDGSTDGVAPNLASDEIDKTIRVRVKNDGEGWLEECGKKDSEEFDLNFNLKQRVADWNKYEDTSAMEFESNEKGVVYIYRNAGRFEYLALHYDNDNLIVKMEYYQEDPG